MATLDKAEALLEELRVASVEAARSDLDEVAAFAAGQARDRQSRVLGVLWSQGTKGLLQDHARLRTPAAVRHASRCSGLRPPRVSIGV